MKHNIHRLSILILILVCVTLFINTLNNAFIWDDKDLILKNKYIRSIRSIPSLFDPIRWRQSSIVLLGRYKFRPISTATFALDYRVWKTNPTGYHISNLLLHTMVVLLVYALMLQLTDHAIQRTPGEKHSWSNLLTVPFLTAFFFAIHPIHTESVTWIKNRSDLLSFLFYLISILCFVEYKARRTGRRSYLLYAASVLCFPLALFSKGVAISLPVTLALHNICFSPQRNYKKSVRELLPFFTIAALYFVLKRTVLQMRVLPGASEIIPPYLNILAVFKTVAYYLKLLAFPFDLHADRIFTIPKSFLDPIMFGSVGLVCILLFLAVQTFRHSKTVSFALFWIFITLLPVSNIIFLYGRPIAEQRLYIPSLGFCILLAIGLNNAIFRRSKFLARTKLRNIVLASFILMSLSYGVTTIARNRDWRDPITFWSKTIKRSQRRARACVNLARAYRDSKDTKKAIALYKEAIVLDPYYAEARYNLSIIYRDLGKKREAVDLLETAIKYKPTFVDAYNDLANFYWSFGRKKEAESLFKKVLTIAPHYVQAYFNLGKLYSESGKTESAILLLKKGIAINAEYPDPDSSVDHEYRVRAYLLLGVLYNNLGKKELAISSFESLLHLDPQNKEAYSNLGVIYRSIGEHDKAITAYRKSIAIDPSDAQSYYRLANVYMDTGRNEDAIALYKKAIEINPRDIAAYDNLGSIYINTDREEEAIAIYKKVLTINPKNALAHNNLAVAYYYNNQHALAIEYCDKAMSLGYSVNPDFLNLIEQARKK